MKNYDLKEALEKKKIISFPAGLSLISKELEAAKEDLLDAKDLFSRERFKSATTLAYYAIFHTARALLYKKGYREKSHIQLGFAIKAFYVDKGLLPQEYYDNFIRALDFRELADYKSKFSKESAGRNIQAAEEAIKLTENLLKNKKP
jgi:uncharacterized protein (UPF0332 family)